MKVTYEIDAASDALSKEVVVYKDGVEYGRFVPDTTYRWKTDGGRSVGPFMLESEGQLDVVMGAISESIQNNQHFGSHIDDADGSGLCEGNPAYDYFMGAGAIENRRTREVPHEVVVLSRIYHVYSGDAIV